MKSMEKMDLKVVVFDWSGTISNDCVNTYNAAMKLRAHFGLPHDLPMDEWLKTTMPNAIDFLKSSGVDTDPKKIIELFQKYYAENDCGPKPYDDAEELLSFLKTSGKNITIVSAHPSEELKNEIDEYGFREFIDEAIGGVRNKADELKSLFKKFSESGIEQSEIVYIGDMVSDIRAAKVAGIKSIGIVRGYHSEESIRMGNPDFVIKSLKELKDIIS